MNCDECDRLAHYNYKDKAKYCFTHKKDGMINLHTKKCLICDKIPPSVLPTYYRINSVRKAPHMVYERRTDSKRYGLTMKLKEGAAIEKELERFNLNLYEKYPEL